MDDPTLTNRLQALEHSVPVTSSPPPLSRQPRMFRPRTILVALAAVLVLAGGAAASGVFEARGDPGAFNPGQPLHCKGVANMTPREAARWLSDRGYDVTWQVEDKTPGVPKGQQVPYQTSTAPDTGFIAAAVVTGGHDMIVVVETGPDAIHAQDCP